MCAVLPGSLPETMPQALSLDLGTPQSLTDGGTYRNPVGEVATGVQHALPG
jgi:hypothetical protein